MFFNLVWFAELAEVALIRELTFFSTTSTGMSLKFGAVHAEPWSAISHC